MKKTGKFLFNLLVFCFIAVAAIAVIFTISAKKDVDGTAEVFGYQLRLVTSDSMDACALTDVSGYDIKSIPIQSLIVVQTIPDEKSAADEWYRSLKVGDVLTFRYVYGSQITITHRITSITEKEGGYLIKLAGDNKNALGNQLYQTIDTSIPNNPNYVVGKVVWNALWPGQLLSTLKTPVGLVGLVLIPCIFIIVIQVIKMRIAVSDEKKARDNAKILEDFAKTLNGGSNYYG